MTRSMLRLAFASSWTGRSRDRLRAGLLTAAVGAATVIACAVGSVILMASRISDRLDDRSFTAAMAGEMPAMRMDTLPDETSDGEQVWVHWVHIVDPDVRIPGIPANPPIGSWFVSPALADRIADDPLQALSFPGARTLGDEGVGNADELVAFRFVGAEVHLPIALSVQDRISRTTFLGGDAEARVLPVVQGALVLMAAPVVALLFAGLAPATPGLYRRLQILRALGAPRSARTRLVFATAAISALPGATMAVLAWSTVAPRLTSVPVVGRSVLRGDMAMPWSLAATIASLAVVATGALAAIRPRSAAGNRPGDRVPTRPPLTRCLPLGFGIALMLNGGGVVGNADDKTLLTGAIATAAGLVISLPVLFSRVGDRLANSNTPLLVLAGRRMSWDATASARTLLAPAALVAVLPLAAAWFETERASIRDEESLTNNVVTPAIRGQPWPGELPGLLESTGTVSVEVALRTDWVPSPGSTTPTFLLVGDCEALSTFVDMKRCHERRFVLPGQSVAELNASALPVEGDIRGVAQLPDGYEVASTLFVSANPQRTEAVLRAHVNNRQQRGPSVDANHKRESENPFFRWVVGGLMVGALTTVATLALHVVAHSSRNAAGRGRLRYLGAEASSVRRLAGVEAASTVLMGGLASCAVGAAASWLYVRSDPASQMPYGAIGLSIITIAFVSLLCAGAASISIAERSHAVAD